jgi:uncharacterized protein
MQDPAPETYDVVVVGLGPAGIMAGHELCGSDVRALLVDKSDYVGGAAFETDVNLQNIDGFPPQSDFGERTLGSRALADTLVREGYGIMCGYGLPRKQPDPVDIYSYAVDQPTLKGVLAAFRWRAEASRALTLNLGVSMRKLELGTTRRWRLSLEGPSRPRTVEADNVLLGTGKLSAVWISDLMDRLGVTYGNNATFALGFRVEGRAETVNSAAAGCENPKIRVTQQGVVSETFCWCKNGKVVAYDFDGAKLLDGEHCYGRPTANSSFGVITTVTLPEGGSNTRISVAFSRYMNAIGEGGVLLQRLGDFLKRRITTQADISANPVQPSLKAYKLCDLRSYFPSLAVEGLQALVAEINQRTPGAIGEDALIYAPILERIFPNIALTQDLETNLKGLFLVGDCSGKGVGVAPAFVMGLAAARQAVADVVGAGRMHGFRTRRACGSKGPDSVEAPGPVNLSESRPPSASASPCR